MDVWEIIGKYYGYPQCCIDSFCERIPFFMRPDEQRQVTQYGFIPCINHAKQILSGKIRIEDLIKDRVCSKPFPTDSMDDPALEQEQEAYIQKLSGPQPEEDNGTAYIITSVRTLNQNFDSLMIRKGALGFEIGNGKKLYWYITPVGTTYRCIPIEEGGSLGWPRYIKPDQTIVVRYK